MLFLCNAPRHDTYMHVVPNYLWGRRPWCQLNIIIILNNWIQKYSSPTRYDAWTYDTIDNNAYAHITSTINTNIIRYICLHQRLNNNSMYDNSTTTYMHITYINTNNIILIPQLHIILTIQLTEKIRHIVTIITFNHQPIIHTTLYIHIKPFMKNFKVNGFNEYFQPSSYNKFHDFKQLGSMNQNKAK